MATTLVERSSKLTRLLERPGECAWVSATGAGVDFCLEVRVARRVDFAAGFDFFFEVVADFFLSAFNVGREPRLREVAEDLEVTLAFLTGIMRS